MNKLKYLIFSGALVVSFQNCSQAQFSQAKWASLGVSDAGDDAPTVCNPFSTDSAAADCATNEGLIGNVYYYPQGIGVQNYIDFGTLLPIYIQLSDLNIPLRPWTDGFPGPDGKNLQAPDGSLLDEYFAINLKGYLKLNSNFPSGDYDFAISSDDGSIVNIDGNVIVDNDGTHSVKWSCSAHAVTLRQGERHSMQVRYYQGPRLYIALQVMWRPASMHGQPCDSSGGWTVVPPEVLVH